MDKSKTIETISKFYSLVGSDNPKQEEKEFVYNFELELAKAMLNEFSNESNRRLAQILLLFVDCD